MPAAVSVRATFGSPHNDIRNIAFCFAPLPPSEFDDLAT